LINLVVEIFGEATVAKEIATSVTAGAVPVGVLNVAVDKLINGSTSKVVVEFDKVVHKILACVPFLYRPAGARLLRIFVMI
jgi:hypothetical protein